MSEGLITSFVSEGAVKELEEIMTALVLISDEIRSVNQISIDIKAPKGMGALANQTEKLAGAMDTLQKTKASFNVVETQYIDLIERSKKSVDDLVKANQGLEETAKSMDNSVKEAVKTQKKYGESTKTTKEFLESLTDTERQAWEERQKLIKETKRLTVQTNALDKALRDMEKNGEQNTQEYDDNKKKLTELQKALAGYEAELKRSGREVKRLVREQNKEEEQLRRSENAYEKMRFEQRKLAEESKRLYVELKLLQESGNATEEELKELAERYAKVTAEANKYYNTLKGAEENVGQFQRNVGNYNRALMVETNHLMRELPNATISFRTFMLSISNNLPMFAEKFKEVMREAHATIEGTSKGFKGALKEVAGHVFSWQMLLIVGVTLAIKYSKEIENFFSAVLSGQNPFDAVTKAINRYNEALNESLKNQAKQIVSLVRFQTALLDASASQQELNTALKKVQEENGGFINGIDLATDSIEKMNEVINIQMDLLRQRAKEEAINTMLEKEMEEAMGYMAKYYKGIDSIWVSSERNLNRYLKRMANIKEIMNSVGDIGGELERSLRMNLANSEKLVERYEEALELVERQIKEQREVNVSLDNGKKHLEDLIKQELEMIGLLEEELQIRKDITTELSHFDKYETERMKVDILRINALLDGNEELSKKYRHQMVDNEATKDIVEEKLKLEKELFDIYKYQGMSDNEAYRQAALNTQLNESFKLYYEWRMAKAKEDKLDKSRGRSRTRTQKEIVGNLDLELELMLKRQAMIKQESTLLGQTQDQLVRDLTYRLNLQDQIHEKALEDAEIEHQKTKLEVNRRIKSAEDGMRISAQYRTEEHQRDILDYEALLVQKERMDIEYETGKANIGASHLKAVEALTKEHYDAMMKLSEENLRVIKANSQSALNEDLVALNEAYRNGNMSHKAYMNQRRRVTRRNRELEHKETIDFYTKEVMLYRAKIATMGHILSEDEVANINKLIDEVELRLKELRSRPIEEKNASWWTAIFGEGFDVENSEQERQAWMDKMVDDFEKLGNAIRDAIGEGIQRKFDAMFERFDEEEERLKRLIEIERDAVNSSLDNEQEKSEKLMDIKAREDAFMAGVEEKRRRARIEQAKTEKKLAIFDIGLATAIAVAKALGSATPPFNFALAGLVASAGAVQLAMASSLPIPAYAEGTDYHKGGLAVVGEKGVEVVQTNQGSFLTPSSATLMDLPRGAKVIPNHELNKAHKEGLSQDIVHRYHMSDKAGMEALSMMFGVKLDELMNTISNKNEVSFHWDNGELRKSIKKGNRRISYVNKII